MLAGVICIADPLREEAAEVLRQLRSLGIRKAVMMTGDNDRTASVIANQVGVDHYYSEVLPEDKANFVEAEKAAGHTVIMLGDGINDSPALARADVGLAIGTGADIAKEGADVVLMRSDLMDVARAIELSRATIRNIKQDLFWALFYNGIGIPLAAGVFFPLTGWQLSPMFGAAAMSFMHGAQDGQKFIGVLFLGMAFCNGQPSVTGVMIPIWLMILCSTIMGVGTSVGGERIIKSVGQDMVKLEKYQGFSADLSSALCLLVMTVLGIPVSTTHTKTSAIMGVGAVRRLSAINFGVVRDMMLTWVFTFPGCGLISFVMAKLFMVVF